MLVTEASLALCAAVSGGVIVGFWLGIAFLGECFEFLERKGGR